MSLELIDRILTESQEIEAYLYTTSGGEPFIGLDLLDLYAKHNDCEFLVYTNGTLIDDSLAERLAELGNVGPAISVEGFEEETDGRRGNALIVHGCGRGAGGGGGVAPGVAGPARRAPGCTAPGRACLIP